MRRWEEITEEKNDGPSGQIPINSGSGYYTVKAGDNLTRIASRYEGVSWNDIFEANKAIKNPDRIFPGQKLLIPHKSLTAEKGSAG
jgi:nucleoid-associated protein YgaU